MGRIGVALMLCCGLLPNAAYARSRSSYGCVWRGERVVVRSRTGVVVKRTQPERGRPRYGQRSETHWWACLRGGSRTYLGRTLAWPAAGGEEGETYDGFRFAGDFLAFHLQLLTNYGSSTEQILEANLSTGRRAALWTVRGEPLSISHIVDLHAFQAPVGPPQIALDAQGEVAWVIRGDARGVRMVLVHNRRETHVVASYPLAEVEPTITDLVISMGQVAWITTAQR